MFEGNNVERTSSKHPLKIWKFGTVINAFYIGFLPQCILLFTDYYRGITSWEFGSSQELEHKFNDALFKGKYANTIFAITTGSFFVILILTFFCSYDLLAKRGIDCKIFGVSCPYSCINYSAPDEPGTDSIQQNDVSLGSDDNLKPFPDIELNKKNITSLPDGKLENDVLATQ